MTLDLKSNTGLLYMKQAGLVQCVIEAVGMDDGLVEGNCIPSDQKPLVKDINGKHYVGVCSYSSVVVMLLYLSGHNLPDIAFTFNCCA